MKFGVFSYPKSTNIGDDIQSLAVLQHVEQDYTLLDRDSLSRYDGDPVVVVMNGWFSHCPQNWPPSPLITPVFFGFHMTPETAYEYAKHRDYFKRHEPIGCRDQATADYLTSWGIHAYVSGCATMTFPKRTQGPQRSQLVLVDQTRKHFPRDERRDHVQITHEIAPYLSPATRLSMAKDLLRFYRDEASLIITSRIHCAMPCAAMGIPVAYTGVREGRTKIIDLIGIPSMETRRWPRTSLKKLRIEASDYEEKKAELIQDIRTKLATAGVKTSSLSTSLP